jgi:hypothetical protein
VPVGRDVVLAIRGGAARHTAVNGARVVVRRRHLRIEAVPNNVETHVIALKSPTNGALLSPVVSGPEARLVLRRIAFVIGQTCPAAKPKPVTNAITASFDNSQATVFNATVNNSSPLPASCAYDAKSALTDTTRKFNVPPNGSHTETVPGVASFGVTKYTVTITCTDTSNTQTEPLGSVTQTVGW